MFFSLCDLGASVGYGQKIFNLVFIKFVSPKLLLITVLFSFSVVDLSLFNSKLFLDLKVNNINFKSLPSIGYRTSKEEKKEDFYKTE